VRLIGYRGQTASVTVSGSQRATHNFTLAADPLNLEAVVVTGTETPRTKLETSNATTVLSAADLVQAAPRSTTEMLRYIPGFTRVESSGGEVNENIGMRGILGVEYVMFLEDGLPVFPTMHTFFMNADNLFRMDQNVERVEVVRGAGSALFGSNTPGAIVNLINYTGGPEVRGNLMASGGTGALARTDFNVNGPIGPDWVQRRRLLPLQPRCARPRVPRHDGWTVEGEPHAELWQRVLPHIAQDHRRPESVHPGPTVQRRPWQQSAVRSRVLRLRIDEHE